jgi:HEPN domain-containing protein
MQERKGSVGSSKPKQIERALGCSLRGESYHLACFVAQQVTEKAITAFIYAQGEEFVIGHSVEALCRMAATFDPDFETLRTAVAPLDGYYRASENEWEIQGWLP